MKDGLDDGARLARRRRETDGGVDFDGAGERAMCYHVSIDGCNILLDCGWTDAFDVEMLKPLEAIAKDVDAVLISHPDTAHLGALPYAFGKLGMNCKVYATLPVHKMGQMYMYDHFLTRQDQEDFQETFSLDDVDKAFAAFVPVKYQQLSMLRGKGEGISVMAYAAGHTLGGAMWKIGKDAEDIIYAVDYNVRKERHLNGATFDSIHRPALLITDASSVEREVPKSTVPRDTKLVDTILSSLRMNGNVLIPIDPAGRVLELILLLEEKWQQRQLGSYQIVLLTNVAYNTLDFAKSHLEWMGDLVTSAFERRRENPFNTKFITICHTMDELKALPPGPKVVLASFGSLEAGPARHLFAEWAGDKSNLVVLTGQPEEGSLMEEVVRVSSKPAAKKNVKFNLSRRVPLEGEELATHESTRKADKSKKEEEKKPEHVSVEEEMVDIKPVEPVEPEEPEPMDVLFGVTTVGSTAEADLRRRETLTEGFTPIMTQHGPMFADEVWDPVMTDYGQEIDIELFMRTSQQASGRMVPELAKEPSTMFEDPSVEMIEEQQLVEAAQEAEEDEEIPTKLVSEAVEVSVKATILTIDFEGKADGQSVRTLIEQAAPRQIVLVHGNAKETKLLKDQLVLTLPGVDIYTPNAGKTVECTSSMATYKIRLSDALFQKAKMRDISGYRVGWVNGIVGKALEEGGAPMLLPMSTLSTKADAGALVTTTSNEMAIMKRAAAQPGSVFLGDLRLVDFRQALAQEGITAEFSGGVLVCADGRVTIRKDSDEKLVIEGALSQDFFEIRQILYSQYQIL